MFHTEKTLTPESRTTLERTIPPIGATIFKGDTALSNPQEGLLKYPQLASFLYQKWNRTMYSNTAQDFFPNRDDEGLSKANNAINYLLTKEGNVSKGFTVTGQVMGMTVAAYKKYRTTDTDRSIDELVKMQMNRRTISESLLWLAARPNDANEEIEGALCIYDGIYDFAIQYDDISFTVDDVSADNPFFIPDPDRLDQLLPREILEAEGDSCPAIYFIPKLWTEMVSIAATDQRFYATDLGLADQ